MSTQSNRERWPELAHLVDSLRSCFGDDAVQVVAIHDADGVHGRRPYLDPTPEQLERLASLRRSYAECLRLVELKIDAAGRRALIVRREIAEVEQEIADRSSVHSYYPLAPENDSHRVTDRTSNTVRLSHGWD